MIMFIQFQQISFVLFVLFPRNLFSIRLQTVCTPLTFPRECFCQRTRSTPIYSSNDTYLRCRQLTEITRRYPWANFIYDRLVFETLNENLTLGRSVFTDLVARTIRFNTYSLFFNNHSFASAHIGQLMISPQNILGRVDFPSNSEVFSGSVITNFHFKSIDFQKQISESVFSNTLIQTLTIHSSKFHGFTNERDETVINLKYDHFLEYDSSLTQIPSFKPILSTNRTSLYIQTLAIISSINTTNLTENYFPVNLVYEQLEEVRLSFNEIHSLAAHVFSHFSDFQGHLSLANNQIQYLHPLAFGDLFRLKNLSLAYNFIDNISSIHFQDLRELYELDLSSNLLVTLQSNTFEYLEHLRILRLNFNPIEFIESNAFANLTNLEEIDFRGINLIEPEWIWNLASLHVIQTIQTDFDLSDVAFCILSRYNQSLFHLSRHDSCSCRIHYFNQKTSSRENSKEYLRLTPICREIFTEQDRKNSKNELILRNLEGQCHYKFFAVDCDAMTAKGMKNNTVEISTKPTTIARMSSTDQPPRRSLNNTKKLFTVLATLVAITLGAIILVFFWYRFKSMLKQRRKKRKFLQHQRHFNTPVTRSPLSPLPRYASVDVLGSTQSEHLLANNQSQFEALSSMIYNNIDSIDKDPIDNEFNKDETPILC
ncbi:unnamed protein product [Adineta ricciae]|uniref:Uncharacterized protein n=1 Tax=Adineta ricciae TaxID=249248 RepID=A0A815GSH6_ADIRI|nr:unnamed protein product [Adineta ricciae]